MPTYETEMKDSGIRGARYEMESGFDKDKEIERLKESAKYDAFLREKYRALITDLIASLESVTWSAADRGALIARAKEATRQN